MTRMCGNAARAAHYFATFFNNSRVIKLHFEYLHCDEQARFCRNQLPAAGVHLYGWALPAPEKLLRPRRRLIANRHSVTS